MSASLYNAVYTLNVVFLTSSLYSWIWKRFYVPEAYRDNFGELFPARRTLATMYLLQLTEIPFLFNLDKPGALFYANGTAMLVFVSYLVILIRGYFFLEFPSPLRIFFFMHPVFVCYVGLLLPIIGVVEYTPLFQTIMTIVILFLFLGYLFILDRLRHKVMRVVREIDEDEFSNESDFPVKFAKSVKWLPLIACLMLLATFLMNSYIAKMVRDVVFSVINIWFALYTMNPHRKAKKLPKVLKKKEDDEVSDSTVKYRLSQKYCYDMEKKLVDMIRDKKLYLEEHFTMNDLTEIMHTNRNYLSEVIARSEFQSFYRLINTMRIEHACDMLQNDSNAKLEIVAIESGFTSGSAFSQVFKRLKDMTPKEYISQIHQE